MASHTRLAILEFTVDTRLMVRETVAMDTLANRATVRMSILSRPSTAARVFFPACLAIRLACPVYVYRIPQRFSKTRRLPSCRSFLRMGAEERGFQAAEKSLLGRSGL